jgi:hypothetical protein
MIENRNGVWVNVTSPGCRPATQTEIDMNSEIETLRDLLREAKAGHGHTPDCYAHGCGMLTDWKGRLLDCAREYRIADDGAEVRDAWRDLKAHVDSLPSILSDAELRAGVAIQLHEIDRLRKMLREESDRVSTLRDVLMSLVAVARRFLPDYGAHTEIQRADGVLSLRPCTCHPDDNPPTPCEHRYAFRDCADAAAERYLRETLAMRVDELRQAVRALAASNAWHHFGDCRAWTEGRILSSSEADELARRVLKARGEVAPRLSAELGALPTMADAVATGDSVLLNEQAALLRECRLALDDLLRQKPMMTGLLCGSTTLGSLRAELYAYRPQGVFNGQAPNASLQPADRSEDRLEGDVGQEDSNVR